MSEIYSIIAEKDRPYEWAYEEMTTYFKNPEKYWVVGLEKLTTKPGVHISTAGVNTPTFGAFTGAIAMP